MLKNQHFDQNSLLLWELGIVTMFMTVIRQNFHCDETPSVWWKSIIVMKIYFDIKESCDENSLLWLWNHFYALTEVTIWQHGWNEQYKSISI